MAVRRRRPSRSRPRGGPAVLGLDLRGGEELAQISRQLRHMGNGREVKKRFTKELRAAAKPLVPAVRASIRAIPSKGTRRSDGGPGLRERMVKATRLSVRTSGRQASVSVRVDGRKMPPGEGTLPSYMEGTKRPWRHPVFGGDARVNQQEHPYFYRVVRPLGIKSRRSVNQVLDDITKEIT